MSGGKPKVTSSDRETARQLCDALVVTRRTANVEEVARILAFVREQILACARVDAERERAREAAGHAAWCRTDGCDGSCRDVRERSVLESVVVQAIEVLRDPVRERKCDHCNRALSMLESALEAIEVPAVPKTKRRRA